MNGMVESHALTARDLNENSLCPTLAREPTVTSGAPAHQYAPHTGALISDGRSLNKVEHFALSTTTTIRRQRGIGSVAVAALVSAEECSDGAILALVYR